MELLLPSALFLGLLALPIILLYMLKLRRRQIEVSSIMLWQMLLRDRQANTPWQKLRRNLLLFLQLFILAALILAIARPAIPVASIASDSVVILLDASASMNVVEDRVTRFDMAKEAVRAVIRDLDGGEATTLILVGHQPIILANNAFDKNILFEALEQAKVTQGGANWQAALALAAGAVSQASRKSSVLIVSDGGLPQTGLPTLPGEVRYLPIGQATENVGLTALSLRASAAGVELFASLKNYGQTEQEVIFSIYRDNLLLDARSLRVSAGEEKYLTLNALEETQGVYFARLTPASAETPGGTADQTLDGFSLDDTAFAIYQPQKAGRVLLVTEENIFLEQVLTAIPTITPFRYELQENAALQLPQEPFDCYVFDSLLPDELPAGNLLLVNPPSNELFQVTGSFKPDGAPQMANHALTEFVDWENVHLAQARQLELPDWAEGLIEIDEQPIVFAGETDGRRVAVLAFDLHDSDLPLQVAFPILFANLMNYLVPPHSFEAASGLLPGESLLIRNQPVVEEVVIATPAGNIFSYPPSNSGILFTQTYELGLYAVNLIHRVGQEVEYFAVNSFDAQESDIKPRSSLSIGRATIQPSPEDQLSLRELWPWLAVLALAVLTFEWWIYHRSSHFQNQL